MGGELLQLPLSGDVQHGSSARVGLQKFPAYVDPSLPELIQSTVGEAEAGLLTLDPSRRTTAAEALRCAFMDPQPFQHEVDEAPSDRGPLSIVSGHIHPFLLAWAQRDPGVKEIAAGKFEDDGKRTKSSPWPDGITKPGGRGPFPWKYEETGYASEAVPEIASCNARKMDRPSRLDRSARLMRGMGKANCPWFRKLEVELARALPPLAEEALGENGSELCGAPTCRSEPGVMPTS
jgi:hypothetical protein